MQEEKTIFEELKKIRLQNQIDLEQIAKSSRIQLNYLQFLEEGDLLKIPEVYDKLFFRSYLKALGVDEEFYYAEFLKYRKKIRVDKTTTEIKFISKPETERKIFNYKNFFLFFPFVIVIIILWLLIRNTEILETTQKSEVPEIDIQSVVKEMQVTKEVKEDRIENITQQLNLAIKGLERTWFRVITDKKDTSEYLFNKGNSLDIQAGQSFEFLIGRADGLQLQLNGKNLGLLGPDSLVINYMLIDSSGIVDKKLKKPKSSNESIKVLQNGEKILYGKISREQLFSYFPEWKEEYDQYTPDQSTLSQFVEQNSPITVEIFFGTWCSDSRREVPRFFKILDMSNFMPNDNVTLWAVDRQKRLDNNLVQRKNIEFVATFIFIKNGSEIARIIETPNETLEKDLLNILLTN